MELKEFEVVLSSGATFIYTLDAEKAVILAQANAIDKGRDYKLISVRMTDRL